MLKQNRFEPLPNVSVYENNCNKSLLLLTLADLITFNHLKKTLPCFPSPLA